MDKTYSILFIGNSYTYYNNMPQIFQKIAKSAGFEVNVEAITSGGYKLYQFANPYDECGSRVERALNGGEKYDYVILQEQSVRPASENAADFYSSVEKLTVMIRNIGARPGLYSTWGRKSGCDKLFEMGWSNESMTYKIAASYQAIGKKLGIKTANAGLAFFDVYTNNKDIELYDPDMSHPSYAGSFLAALTLFMTVFGFDVETLEYNGTLDAESSRILKVAAKTAASGGFTIPDEYRIQI